MLKNDRLLKALANQPVDKTPIWVMRQAGRYLPEYLKVRKEAGSFLKLCKTPELACEVTLQPLRRFDLDAAIIFSDILTIPDAMGLGLYFSEGEGPKFENPLRSHAAIEKLIIPEPEESLSYVTDAIRLTKNELNNTVPLIGFSGSPWTLACYMIEGGSSKTFSIIKKMLYQEPKTLTLLLEKLSASIVKYLNAQISAGADVIMILDTWGGILSGQAYEEFSLHFMQLILDNLPPHIPTIMFTKNGGLWLQQQAKTGCTALGLDWTMNLHDARQQVGDQVCLQGNLDPNILTADEAVIRREVHNVLASYGAGSGHVFNLGHGILPHIPPEHVEILVDAVHEISAQYHKE